jgi:hypothetical protein
MVARAAAVAAQVFGLGAAARRHPRIDVEAVGIEIDHVAPGHGGGEVRLRTGCGPVGCTGAGWGAVGCTGLLRRRQFGGRLLGTGTQRQSAVAERQQQFFMSVSWCSYWGFLSLPVLQQMGIHQGRTGPQAGSERRPASAGAVRCGRSDPPARSSFARVALGAEELDDPAIGRPGRRLVLPAIGQVRMLPPLVFITATLKSPAMWVKAIWSPRGLHSGVAQRPPKKLMRAGSSRRHS